MWLQSLHLINFKNYGEVKLDLTARINVLVGKNGSGKTNLLDAIHFLSLTRSAFCADQHAIRKGENFFTVKGEIKAAKNIGNLFCSIQTGSKKVFRDGANEYQKLSEHIGKYPVVLIAPDDTDLVKEGSEERRKFFDTMLSQLDRHYLDALIQYNFALKQRNSLLKMFADLNSIDNTALETYDQILIRTGKLIHHRRAEFVREFIPVFQEFYSFLVADEHASIEYSSELAGISFEKGLQASRQRDLFLQRTNFGIHRDDYLFTLGDGDLKRLGSQGQQKSFIIALKLAQFKILEQHKGFKPILLLDDIFDKLDDFRIQKLLELIRDERLGQIFITDARPDRTQALLESINISASFFKVDHGTITQ